MNNVDNGQDVIAIFIKRLFNSPDGVNFVATTYDNDPVGHLSRNLGAVIKIIDLLVQLDTHKEDTFANTSLTEAEQLQLKQSSTNIKNLERTLKIKKLELEKEKNNQKLIKEINLINIDIQKEKLIINPLLQKKNKQKSHGGIQPQSTSVFHEHIFSEIQRIMDITSPLKKENEEFVNILKKAYFKQGDLANPRMKQDEYLYPQNIVITALWAFVVQVADDKNELEPKGQLSLVMKESLKKETEFSSVEYYQMKKKMHLNAQHPNTDLLKHPEYAFLMRKGFQYHESAFAEPIDYRSDTLYNGQVFPDCGEISLLNVLGILLAAGNHGHISDEVILNLEKIFPKAPLMSPFRKLISFLKTYRDISTWSTLKVHSAWANVVSNLNIRENEITMNSVIYGQRIQKINEQNNIYEIMANSHNEAKGIINMFNVIARLLPDPIFKAPWKDNNNERFIQIARRLTRLCTLLSHGEIIIDWEHKSTKNKVIDSEFPHIIFKDKNSPVFVWKFTTNHFRLDPVYTSDNDWCSSYHHLEEKYFPNEWMASLFLKPARDEHIANEHYGSILPLSLIYNRNIRSLDGVIEALSFVIYRGVIDDKLKQFYPLLLRWINKSISLNDEHSLHLISLLLYGVNYEIPFMKIIFTNNKYNKIVDKFNLIKKLHMYDSSNLLGMLKEIIKDFDWRTPFLLIAKNRGKELQYFDLAKDDSITNYDLSHLSHLTMLNLKKNSTITNEGLKHLPNLTSLILENNNTITDEGLKYLPKLTGLNLNHNNTITNAGLKHLPNLKFLELIGNRTITDEGLAHYTMLTELELSKDHIISNSVIEALKKHHTVIKIAK